VPSAASSKCRSRKRERGTANFGNEGQIRDAELAVQNARVAAAQCKQVRDAAEKRLRWLMRSVVLKLSASLEKGDARWRAVGLRIPRPGAPAGPREAPAPPRSPISPPSRPPPCKPRKPWPSPRAEDHFLSLLAPKLRLREAAALCSDLLYEGGLPLFLSFPRISRHT
jgi:hypothetical protein